LYNVIPENNSQSRSETNSTSRYNFTGNIVITNLSGIVLNNFQYNSGNLLGEINLNSYGTDPDPCWGITCGIQLDEIVITAPRLISPYYYAYANHYSGGFVYQWNRSLNNYSSMGHAYANYYRRKAIEESISGDKPLYEYNNKCNGINKVWELSEDTEDEFVAVLTTDGAVLITQRLNSDGGGISGIYTFNGTTYYQYPTSLGAPSRTYAGQIINADRYFIPIIATIHSHTPCLNDGTDGVSNNIIDRDREFAATFPNINNYIIGCNSIGQFNGNSNQAFNIQHGNLNTLCNNIN
ncbi:MAG: hypothetical protein KAJ28_10025, partial [Flavobacteriaceae bacterium]|nr:hypothetical protein [Flavobacteriaceae bacterium]